MSDAVAAEHFHPLGGERTSEFLKDLVQRFWSHGQYVESEDEIEAASGPVVFRQPHLLLGNRNQGLAENIDRLLESLDADGQELDVIAELTSPGSDGPALLEQIADARNEIRDAWSDVLDRESIRALREG